MGGEGERRSPLLLHSCPACVFLQMLFVVFWKDGRRSLPLKNGGGGEEPFLLPLVTRGEELLLTTFWHDINLSFSLSFLCSLPSSKHPY